MCFIVCMVLFDDAKSVALYSAYVDTPKIPELLFFLKLFSLFYVTFCCFGSFLGTFWALFSLFGSLGRLGGSVLGSRGVILGTCGPEWDQISKKAPNMGLFPHPFWITFWGFGGRGAQKVHKKCSLGKTPENERQHPEKNVVSWKVGHAIRTRGRSPNKLFAFLCVT